MSDVPKVYAAINRVQNILAAEGLAKTKNNTQQNYKFRGIDDLYNSLSRVLVDNYLIIVPSVVERDCIERASKAGGALFNVTLKVVYTFISTEDGSMLTSAMYGEAMDSADKATNKALSAAYKYLCLQTFCIPTEGDNDADMTTHEVEPNAAIAAVVSEKEQRIQATMDLLRDAMQRDDDLGWWEIWSEFKQPQIDFLFDNGTKYLSAAMKEYSRRVDFKMTASPEAKAAAAAHGGRARDAAKP